MIKSKICLLADGVVRDSVTNNVSVFNIFEEITPERMPFVVPRIVAYTLLEREETDPAQIEILVKIKNNDETAFERNIPVDFRGLRRDQLINTFAGMPVRNSGVLSLEIHFGEELLSSYDVLINPPRQPIAERQ